MKFWNSLPGKMEANKFKHNEAEQFIKGLYDTVLRILGN